MSMLKFLELYLQAYFGDIVCLVPGNLNKVKIKIKQVTGVL
jgi:hypothetical protein